MKPFLKCDAAGCDHVEEVDDFREEFIGKPCPKCGASLLTREDWVSMQPIIAMMKVFADMGLLADADASGGVPVMVGHHAGETTIKIKDAK